jgi:formamidopyrimidine-DNA glycosylase
MIVFSSRHENDMPELPDIVVDIEALERRILSQHLLRARIANPYLLLTVEPPVSAAENKRVPELRLIGKRIAIGLEDELWLLVHLMIVGRMHWRKPGAVLRGKVDLAAFDFPNGNPVLSESGTNKQASLHIV